MNSELEKILYQIDKKIKALEQAKRVLLEEFGDHRKPLSTQPSLTGIEKSEMEESPKKKTRARELIDLLTQEGPLTRSEIITKTNIPKGTIATALNDKKVFYHEGNKWYLKAEKTEK